MCTLYMGIIVTGTSRTSVACQSPEAAAVVQNWSTNILAALALLTRGVAR